jgi:hypothetical protein
MLPRAPPTVTLGAQHDDPAVAQPTTPPGPNQLVLQGPSLHLLLSPAYNPSWAQPTTPSEPSLLELDPANSSPPWV